MVAGSRHEGPPRLNCRGSVAYFSRSRVSDASLLRLLHQTFDDEQRLGDGTFRHGLGSAPDGPLDLLAQDGPLPVQRVRCPPEACTLGTMTIGDIQLDVGALRDERRRLTSGLFDRRQQRGDVGQIRCGMISELSGAQRLAPGTTASSRSLARKASIVAPSSRTRAVPTSDSPWSRAAVTGESSRHCAASRRAALASRSHTVKVDPL